MRRQTASLPFERGAPEARPGAWKSSLFSVAASGGSETIRDSCLLLPMDGSGRERPHAGGSGRQRHAIMRHVIEVALHERAIVLEDGLPREALGPGRHVRWGFRIDVVKVDTRHLVVALAPEARAVLPAGWIDEVRVASHERAVLYRDGVPQLFLRPGIHRFWTVDETVELKLFSVDQPMPPLGEELMRVIPRSEYVDVLVEAHEVGLHYVQGRLVGVREPGRYALWSHPEAVVAVRRVDLRRQDLQLAGQELITRDKVTLRLTLTATWAVKDAALMAESVENARDAVYLMVQLAARDYVAGVTLDQLLEGRDELRAYLERHTASQAEAIGVRLERVGVKDVVLPGEMKALLNRVIEAEKEAAANVILRREETAATRSLANTAKVMADNPVLLRLKELEAVKEIAAQVGEVRLVVGSDGLEKLIPAGLLGGDLARR